MSSRGSWELFTIIYSYIFLFFWLMSLRCLWGSSGETYKSTFSWTREKQNLWAWIHWFQTPPSPSLDPIFFINIWTLSRSKKPDNKTLSDGILWSSVILQDQKKIVQKMVVPEIWRWIIRSNSCKTLLFI